MTHPQDRFRSLFYRDLLALNPRSVLDVGCGNGTLVSQLRTDGIDAQGVDANPRDEFDASPFLQCAHAEKLPFDDASFDWTVSQFSPHHWSNLTMALKEGLRVSRQGWFIIDQWHDLQIAEQRVADRFDRWRKSLDRESGMVHHPSFSTSDYVRAFSSLDLELKVRVHTLYEHALRPDDNIEELIEKSLELGVQTSAHEKELTEIRSEIKSTGMTYHGTLVVSAEKALA